MKIEYEISNKMNLLLKNAIKSNGAKKGFGVIPNQQQFITGLIYYWLRKNTPELLLNASEIIEIKEHKSLKK